MEPLSSRIHLLFVAFVLHSCFFTVAIADAPSNPTITPSPAVISPSTTLSRIQALSPPPNATCESKTINYITHSLASICLRQNRSHHTATIGSPPATSSFQLTEEGSSSGTTAAAAFSTADHLPSTSTSSDLGTVHTTEPDPESALDDASFLSFEDWKKQTLEKEGLIDAANIDRRTQAGKEGDKRKKAEGVQSALEGLAEGADIDLDFGAFLGDRKRESATTNSNEEAGSPAKGSQSITDEEQKADMPKYRSKDAGKTCKERFNFASMDAGGQVMKANPEAKSASALLSENRDVYLLNTCQAKNKFFIVELSESILVETVALANFEFFSSTFRQFRVSVSDRYPQKLDRWVEIGMFEARNSREIQAFLVEDPRIWARYLRVEFLSHFGKEFYCPVSLLRVHGRTMIQDVLNMEQGARGDDDGDEDIEELKEEQGEVPFPEAVVELTKEEKNIADGLKEAQAAIEDLMNTAEAVASEKLKDALNSSHILEVSQLLESVSTEQLTTAWSKHDTTLQQLFDKNELRYVCSLSDSPDPLTANSQLAQNITVSPEGTKILNNLSNSSKVTTKTLVPLVTSNTSSQSVLTGNLNGTQILAESLTRDLSNSTSSTTVSATSHSTTISSKAQEVAATSTNKLSSTTVPHPSQPTTQESFFKTVSKRLQLLEANSTLSLKYIEEQSRILRDAFTKVEKRQLSKTTCFLENLNSTVLEELRKFGKQYDQIWQSTVMELETQRDQSLRESVAMSARLNILADELVFQKRMSIIQSILLLLCLAVVVFSRSLYIEIPNIQRIVSKARNTSDDPYESPPFSPETQRAGSHREANPWTGSDHRRHRSDESGHSTMSRSQDDYSPPTPVSSDSKHDEDYKHITENDDVLGGVRRSLVGGSMVDNDSSGYVSRLGLPSWTKSICEEASGPGFTQPLENHNLSSPQSNTIPDTPHGARLDGQGNQILRSVGERYNNRTSDSYVVEQGHRTEQIGLAVSSPAYPYPPPKNEKSEFKIGRKPLPALPREE
jgi:hypothetical protein